VCSPFVLYAPCSRVNEAAANLPRWAEFETRLFTPAAAAAQGAAAQQRRRLRRADAAQQEQRRQPTLGVRPPPLRLEAAD
jgi:hypothetical protein